MDSDEYDEQDIGELVEEFEAQLENVTDRELLIEVMAEVKAIRYGLETGDFGMLQQQEQAQSETEIYLCKTCSGEVKKSKRQQHLIKHHNAPAGMPVEDEFTKA